MWTEIIKTKNFYKDLFDIINCDAFGIVFWKMALCKRIQLCNMDHGMFPIIQQQLCFEYAQFTVYVTKKQSLPFQIGPSTPA